MPKQQAIDFCAQFPNGRLPDTIEEAAELVRYVENIFHIARLIGLQD